MGLQHNTQDMNKIPLKYHINVLFYTKYTHPTLISRGTDARTHARKIFTQYSGISSCSLGSTDLSEMRECKSIFQILKLSLNERLQTYVREHNIVDIEVQDTDDNDDNDDDDRSDEENEGDDLDENASPDAGVFEGTLSNRDGGGRPGYYRSLAAAFSRRGRR